MAGAILATQAVTDQLQLADARTGIPVMLHIATVRDRLRQGIRLLQLEIHLDDISLDELNTGWRHRQIAPAGPEVWLTVSNAARLHVNDVDGMTFEHAKVKISRACRTGEIESVDEGRARRINPTSLDAWRLAQREADLDRSDE